MLEFGADILKQGFDTPSGCQKDTSCLFSAMIFCCFPNRRQMESIVPSTLLPSFLDSAHIVGDEMRSVVFGSFSLPVPRPLPNIQTIPLRLLAFIGVDTTALQIKISLASYERYILTRGSSKTQKSIAETLEFLSNSFPQHMRKRRKGARFPIKMRELGRMVRGPVAPITQTNM